MFLCQAPKTPVNLSAQGGNNENIREKESPVSAGAKQRKDMIKMEPHDGEFLSHANHSDAPGSGTSDHTALGRLTNQAAPQHSYQNIDLLSTSVDYLQIKVCFLDKSIA